MAACLLEQLPRTIAPLAIPIEAVSAAKQSQTFLAVDQAQTTPTSPPSPLWVLLASEVVEMNQKVLMVRSCLTGVVAEVRSGTVVQEQVYEALSKNMVPVDWKVSY